MGLMSKTTQRRKRSSEGNATTGPAPDPDQLIGQRIQHAWRENGTTTCWKGTVLERPAVMDSLYMVKYDGFDCVYGIELFKDTRVSLLQVLTEPVENKKIKRPAGVGDLVGKAIEHLFEKDNGKKDEWRGMVLSRAPILTHWYYLTYEKDPVLYMYQVYDDLETGDLRILREAEHKNLLPQEKKDGEEKASLVGKKVEYLTDKGQKRTGLVLFQVASTPSVYYIKYDDDYHIHVYDLVETK